MSASPISTAYDELELLLARLEQGCSLAETTIVEHDNLELVRGELRFVVTAQEMMVQAARDHLDALWQAIQAQKGKSVGQEGRA